MLRYHLKARERLTLETDVPIPTPSQREVLVRVKACAVCNRSDLVYYYYLGRREHCAKGCFGHEIAGVVEEIGRDVTKVVPGDRVFIRTPLTSGFAEYALAKENAIGRLPDCIPFPHGAILQLLPLMVNATRIVSLGMRVLIVGQGPVGLMALQVVRLRGASHITVTDLDPWRLKVSAGYGADETLHVREEPGQKRSEMVGLPEFDVAIDAVGTPHTVRTCMNAVRKSGHVILLGTHHIDTHVTFDLIQFEKKALCIHSSAEATDYERAEAMKTAESLIHCGKINLQPLHTHTWPLRQLPEAITHLSENSILFSPGENVSFQGPPPRTLKVVICP